MGSPQDPDHGRRPKRINSFLGLYDAPPHRDWLVWWTVAWIVVAGLAIGTSSDETRSTSLPVWLDALLAAVVFGVLFGIFPAYLRLLVRRWRYRRSARRGANPTSMPESAPSAGSPITKPSEPSAPTESPSAPPRSADEGFAGSRHRPIGTPSAEAPVAPPRPPPSQRPTTGAGHGAARPTSNATPSRIDALDTSMIHGSAELSRARTALPYPVARAARGVQGATTLRDAYDGVLRGSEALVVALGVVVMTWAGRHRVTTPQVDDLRAAMLSGGVSQGHWIQALASMERAMARHADPLVGLTDALKRGKGGAGLIADLQQLVQERNRWAHGAAPRNELEASERLQSIFGVFERALDRAAFLTESPWVLTNDSKFRRREGDFEVHASLAMGDHPDFEHTSFVSPQPLAEDVFYLRTHGEFLDMTPLVVMRQCPTCQQREVAYADRLDERAGVSLKTFDRGHVLFDQDLVDELRAVGSGGPGGAASNTA